MIASRSIARSARTLRAPVRTNARQVRFVSTEEKKTAAAAGGSSGLVGGLVGGAIVFGAGYTYYHFSGAKTIVTSAKSAKSQLDKLTSSLKESAPEPNEALKWLRTTAQSYAAFIPGAKSYVDSAFNDLDKIEASHRGEVEEIVKKAYEDLKGVSDKGMNMESAAQAWNIIQKSMTELGQLAADSAGEILDNHPELKNKVGGNLDQLKSMAQSYGPEAKKELDQTYSQIKDIVAGGVGVESIAKVKKLVDDKVEKMKSLGDEAWKKGMEQAKPYLDKNPKIREIVEKNASSLKQGNYGELFSQVKESATSGNTESLEKYVKSAGEKAKKTGLGQSLEGYAKMIPGSGNILPKLQQLQEIAQSHGEEAEKLLKDTFKDVEEVLQKRVSEAEKLAGKAGQEAKK